MAATSGHQAAKQSPAQVTWIEDLDDLSCLKGFDPAGLPGAAASFAFRLNSYYLGLIRHARDPLGRQVIPDGRELDDPAADYDPLNEDGQSPVAGLVRRYPDRVLLLVSDTCAVHCRFCMRRRKVGRGRCDLGPALEYICADDRIKEVILSGGDPLMLSDTGLEKVLLGIRQIPHVEIIRIHSRIPCVWPQRITAGLVEILGRFHPLYLVAHFNHPLEITPAAATACGLLAKAGIPVGCQTVLLAGINDDPKVMANLLRGLLTIRVRPYYLHQIDRVPGTAHFQVPLEQALELMAQLRGHLSGLAIPQLMIDLPAGGGKIPLLPEYIVSKSPGLWKIRNFQGRVFDYPVLEPGRNPR